MTTLKALPIACTLSPDDFRERLRLIHTLSRNALLGYERRGLALDLCYAPAAVDRVRAMVERESHCCTFLTFAVCEGADAVRVTITAPERARDAADELFAQFIAPEVMPQNR
jgi:hypothetical protein